MAKKADAENGHGVVVVRQKRNPVKKDLQLVQQNLNGLARRYLKVASLKDGEWRVPADAVMTLENATVYVTEALTEFLDTVKAQAR